jgi:aminoglycoside 2'-N-acetyltransferase I
VERIRRLNSSQLSAPEIDELRALMDAAFVDDEHGGFDEDDWQHALGGVHFVLERDGAILSHAAVVARELHVAGRAIRTGYVEAVATWPAEQGRGYGTVVMREVNSLIEERYELGALGTGSHAFYERLGWRTWRGPSHVRTANGLQRTPEDDGSIMVLLTAAVPNLDIEAPISCDWRRGDVW